MTAAPICFKGSDGDPIEIGYCTKHQDLAKRYGDGSWACWWECTVMTTGEHDDRDFVPLVAATKDTE